MNSAYPIESFKMFGLHGYKDISLEMKGKTTIFVSENGTGKTTILNALRFILEKDFFSLKQIPFSRIVIKLNGGDDFEICRSDIEFDAPIEYIRGLIETELGINDDFWEEGDISSIIGVIMANDVDSAFESNILKRMYMSSPCAKDKFINTIKKIKSDLGVTFAVDDNLINAINKIQLENEIIFLPTYRRVEKKPEKKTSNVPMGFRRPQPMVRNCGTRADKIYYGLQDVEDTLGAITFEIERASNVGYRTLSAKMLEDLIRHDKQNSIGEQQLPLPSIEDLERFLKRVNDPISTSPFFHPQPTIDNGKSNGLMSVLKDMYSEDRIKDITYLNYFLSQLNMVIQETKEQESKIEKFVSVCNKYLTSSGDSKQLRFDPSSLEVIVSDNYTRTRIALNDLSSGEKQVISLMAIINLNDNKNKIIMIDEPELSLSIKWQRMLLPDIDASDDVTQIIAITHSPFIFDNDLDCMAATMEVKREVINEQ